MNMPFIETMKRTKNICYFCQNTTKTHTNNDHDDDDDDNGDDKEIK